MIKDHIDINYRENNFDMLRLFAALQVLILHSIIWFGLEEAHTSIKKFSDIIWFFPGVTIFFAISGFLIFKSLLNKGLAGYFKNRFLRIYPALWACFLVTLLILFYFHIINVNELFSYSFIKYTVAQVTFFQYYVPEEYKTLGIGHPNGALWTISVELQFYIAAWLIYTFLLSGSSLKKQNLVILFLTVLSIIINYWMNTNLDQESLVYKLLFVSILPFFYYFSAGIFFIINYKKLIKWVENKALVWTIIFAGVVFLCLYFKILKHNDISYGLYLYHCLILNVVLEIGFSGRNYIIGIGSIFLLAILSWIFIERRALRLK
jgi:peptidoglycan/LPS O-acetylase OafA/YrhL